MKSARFLWDLRALLLFTSTAAVALAPPPTLFPATQAALVMITPVWSKELGPRAHLPCPITDQERAPTQKSI